MSGGTATLKLSFLNPKKSVAIRAVWCLDNSMEIGQNIIGQRVQGSYLGAPFTGVADDFRSTYWEAQQCYVRVIPDADVVIPEIRTIPAGQGFLVDVRWTDGVNPQDSGTYITV